MTIKKISLLLLSSVLLGLSIFTYLKRTLWLGDYYGATDFFRFYQSTLFYFSGQNIYSNTIVEWARASGTIWLTANANLNLPFFTVLLLPLHYFNYANALFIWNSFSILLMLLGVLLALNPFPQWHKNSLPIMALFLLYVPNADGLAWGQITAVLLVVLAAAWLLARRHRDFSAGILIGLACAIKLFCGLFLIYFLCLKRLRLFFVSFLVFLATVVIGGIVTGFHSYVSYLLDLNKVGWYASTWNVSFYGFFMRLFSTTNKNVPLIHIPHLASLCTQLCSVMVMTYLILWWKKWGTIKFDRGFSLVLVSMLLLSPLGWLYYFPLLLIPYLVLVSEGNDGTHIILCVLLLCSTLMGHLIKAKTIFQIFCSGGLGFYVLLALIVLLTHTFKCTKKIPEKYWPVIYSITFIPSLISLGLIFKDL